MKSKDVLIVEYYSLNMHATFFLNNMYDRNKLCRFRIHLIVTKPFQIYHLNLANESTAHLDLQLITLEAFFWGGGHYGKQ